MDQAQEQTPAAVPLLEPAEFTDLADRTWRLALNVALAAKIRTELGLDLVNVHDGKAMATLGQDTEKLVACLWLLCEAKATADGISPEEFAAGLGGDVLDAGEEAVAGCLVNFCRSAKRAALKAVREKVVQLKAKETEFALKKIQSPLMDEAIEKKLEQASLEVDQKIRREMAGK